MGLHAAMVVWRAASFLTSTCAQQVHFRILRRQRYANRTLAQVHAFRESFFRLCTRFVVARLRRRIDDRVRAPLEVSETEVTESRGDAARAAGESVEQCHAYFCG